MKICQLLSSMSRLGAGVSGFVLPLSQNISNIGMDLVILSLEDAHSSEDLRLWKPLTPILLESCINFFGFSKYFFKVFDNISPSLIHQHGLWMYPSFVALLWSRKHQIPRIISPHGMLEPWAWRHKNWKKRPIWYLWEKQNHQTAAAIHVTSEQEMIAVRNMGVTAPIAVIPIGIDIPVLPPKSITSASSRKTIVFLSRIHPKKGLANLINAWAKVCTEDWQIIIAGPSEQNYLNELKSQVQHLSLESTILFQDAVYGHDKWQLFANSDLFVLPSFSENFGIVIAEALACGLPVITTRATPWSGLVDKKCGWWIETGVEPLAEALSEATRLSTDQLKAMGQHGKNYMEQEFTWEESTLKMKMLYEWALYKQSKPDFVYLG